MAERPATHGFQKPVSDPSRAKNVGLPIISYVGNNAAACSCGGWAAARSRPKVLEDAIDRHLTKQHGGRGIRL